MSIFRDLAVVALIAAALAGAALGLSWLLARAAPRRLTRANFLGRAVPVIGGFPLVAVGTLMGGFFWSRAAPLDLPDAPVLAAYVIALAGFGALGLIDDLFGDRSVGGFRGHFRRLVRERRVTTGLVKALGGGLVALAATWAMRGRLLEGASAATVALLVALYGAGVALAANSSNLLDLRPGRCLTAALIACLGAFPAAMAHHLGAVLALLSITAGIALALPAFDRAGKIMLGDMGANAVGAAVGVCYAALERWWEALLVALLLTGFQLWCERHSLSRVIEATPWLRRLDRKIGVRE